MNWIDGYKLNLERGNNLNDFPEYTANDQKDGVAVSKIQYELKQVGADIEVLSLKDKGIDLIASLPSYARSKR